MFLRVACSLLGAVFLLAGYHSKPFCCEVPVFPLEARVRVSKGRIRLKIANNYQYWQKKIFSADSLSELETSSKLQKQAEEYINEHFNVVMDGRKLKGKLLRASFVQDPWQSTDKAEVRFILDYPIGDTAAEALVVNSSMFFDDEEHHHHGHEHLVEHQYSANILLQTGKKGDFALNEESPEVTLKLSDFYETFLQRAFYFFNGGGRLIVYAPAVFVLMLLVLFGFGDWKKAAGRLAALIFLASVGFFAGRLFSFIDAVWLERVSVALIAVSGALMCAFRANKAGINTAAASGLVLGVYSLRQFRIKEAIFDMSLPDLMFFGAGFIALSVFACAAGIMLILCYKNKLKKRYESIYEKKYDESRYFAVLITTVISVIALAGKFR